MYECRTCVRRLFYTIFADALKYSPSPPRVPVPQRQIHRASGLQRGYATEILPIENAPTPSPTLDVGVRNPYVPQQRRPSEQHELFNLGNLGKEVKWLRDPLKLGDHTVKLLRQNDPLKALAIVRLASKHVQCTVSWNYMIDYHMSKGNVKSGVQLYNEMKKRAQFPDAHTFTTLFRGFSWNHKNAVARSKAFSIYHAMFADNSPVRPSIIHTNAMLKFCALTNDVDGLLGVAAKLPSRGNGAADNLTFTIILNAIRHEALDCILMGKAAHSVKGIQAIMQGRRLWKEVRERWLNGDLRMDEDLVCAMGRLLLLGAQEAILDDVLSLVEQVVGIPRQVPRIGEPGREQRKSQVGNTFPISKDTDAPLMVTQEAEDSYKPEGDPFASLPNGVTKTGSLVRPGPNTLSLVVEACIRLGLGRAAQNYWGILTVPSGPFHIVPDVENYHMYLRLLRVQRASRLAVGLIDDMSQGALGPKIKLEPKTFRIGLACCVRDKKNPNSLIYAAKLVGMMNASLEFPDPRALDMYLKLGLSQEPRDWRRIMGILREVDLGIQNLRSLFAYDLSKGKEHIVEVKALVQSTKGAYDIILDIGNEAMSDKERKYCKERRHTLAAWITRMADQKKDFEQSQNGQTYLKERKEGRLRPRFDEIGYAHENRDARGVLPKPPPTWTVRRPVRMPTIKRTETDVAPSTSFTPV